MTRLPSVGPLPFHSVSVAAEPESLILTHKPASAEV